MTISEPQIPETIIASLHAGELANVLESLESFLKIHPQAHQARSTLVNVALQNSRLDRALPHLRILALEQPDAQVFFALSQISEAFGFIDEAYAQIQRALALEPSNRMFIDSAVRLANRCQPGKAFTLIHESCAYFKEQGEPFKFLASSLHTLEEHLHQSLYRSHRPLLFIGIGHSAGAYITAEMARLLGMHMWAEPIAIGQAHHAFLSEPALEKFLKFGGVNHTHMFPGAMNCEMLLASGLRKLVINIRDPRQIAFSNTHWLLELKKRHSESGVSKYEPASLKGYLSENYYSLSFEEQVDWMIETEIPILVDWMQGWFEFCQRAKGTIETKITRFEDFKTDQNAYFMQLLNFYQVPLSEWRGEPLECKAQPDGRPGAHAFRKGKIDEWRHEMTPRQKQRCNQLVPESFLRQFGYEI